MKKKKSLMLVVALLLVTVTSGVVTLTYSRYLSSATGSSTATVAPWVVKVNDTDIVAENTFTDSDITWESNDYIAADYIAPGKSGTFDIVIDPTGSKVAVQYEVSIDSSQITNDNMTISSVKVGEETLTANESGKYVGTLSLEEVEAGTTETLTVTINWEDKNTTDANTADTTTGTTAGEIEIPVTVTVSQYLG